VELSYELKCKLWALMMNSLSIHGVSRISLAGRTSMSTLDASTERLDCAGRSLVSKVSRVAGSVTKTGFQVKLLLERRAAGKQ
jgi:hypothetical protein